MAWSTAAWIVEVTVITRLTPDEVVVVVVDCRTLVVVVVGISVVVVLSGAVVVVVLGLTTVVVVVVDGGTVLVEAVPHTWISASPMFFVVGVTFSTRSFSDVIVLSASVRVRASPLLGSAPVVIRLPSGKKMVAPVIWSSALGRSYKTILEIVTGDDQVSCIQLPSLPESVAHSLV